MPFLKRLPIGLVGQTALAVSICLAGCRGGAKLTELQRSRSGSFDVVLLSPHDALRHGKDTFVLEFRTASTGELVDVGEVRASATMPMAGMPMLGSIEVKRTDVPGRYSANGQFDMAGTWRLSVEWNGPSGQGSITFSGAVQ